MDIEAELDAAIEHHKNGRLDEARAVYDRILSEHPAHVHTLCVSAILLFQGGDADAAIARLEAASQADPTAAAPHNNLGNILREQGRMKEALARYRIALDLAPGHVDTLCNVGVLCRNLHRVDEALELFERAHAIDPNHAETNHNLGLTYAMLDRLDEAADCIEACYAEDRVPVVDPAWHARILVRLGRRERAIEIMEKHVAARPDNPVAHHELAALRGDPQARAPDDYVRSHFDGFADGFESRLEQLGYHAPRLVGELVGQLCDGKRMRFVIDLGCGTGLLGPLVREHAEHLIGVDLSPRMLLHAERRNVYDNLVEAELTAFLGQVPEKSIDLALATDTLVYFGALDDVFAGLARALRQGGAFIGTTELESGEGFSFLHTGRYSHSEAYLARAARAAGLTMRIARPIDLRMDLGELLPGLVFAVENTGDPA